MFGKITATLFVVTVVAMLDNFGTVTCNPAIGEHRAEKSLIKLELKEFLKGSKNDYHELVNYHLATGFDAMEICIENCAQCRKMLGGWFEGQLCADSCIKFKGKLIPDCENLASISPFLNKL